MADYGVFGQTAKVLQSLQCDNPNKVLKIDDFLSNFAKVKKTNNGWIALCPGHLDDKQSLSISEANGKILLYCFAGCETQRIVSALGLTMQNLFEDSINQTPKKKKQIVEIYDYTDENNNLLFQKVRYEPKGFTQRKPNGKGGFDYKLKGVKSVLYRLPEVLMAKMVFIVEGEKDVETLRQHGQIATCNPQGALKWKDEYNEALHDKTVVILPDNDDPGREHALQVANSLDGTAKEIIILELPNLRAKGDVSDFFQDGGTIDEIISLVERAESWQPNKNKIDNSTNQSISSFQIRADGVYFVGHDQKKNERICSVLNILAETQTNTGENYGRLVEWKDSKNRLHHWAMPIELAHSDSNEHIKYFVSRGLELNPTKIARQKLSEYIVTSKPDKTIICTDKTGWQDNCFVLPDKTIGQSNVNESIIFQSAFAFDHRFQTAGSLVEWQQNISRLCVGNSRLVFAVSTAFASCLLLPLQEKGGGFHFRGSSSVGKSTALLVGGSVWGGDSRQGFLNTWRTTANGLESVATLHNDSLLCLDELKECDPRTASEVAYMLANGQGKGRMSKNIFARKSLTWTLLFLSSGELSLRDLIEQSGGRFHGGQEVRMCDIPADAEKGFGLFENLHEFPRAELFAKQLSENSKKYYGVAIREFLQNISFDLENLKNRWQNFRTTFMQSVLPDEAKEEVQRVASRFALVAFGGYLARDICGWTANESTAACKVVFRAWLTGRNGEGNTDTENGISQIRYFLELHGNSRFQDLIPGIHAIPEQKIISRAGFKRTDNNNETEFLIFPEVFRKEVCKGFDVNLVANILKARNISICDKDKTTKTVRLKNEGVKKMYVISSRIFEGHDEQPDEFGDDIV